MNTQNKYGRVSFMALVALGLFATLLTGCAHHNEHEGRRDRYGYLQTRDAQDNPTDNAAIRHERRGHNRWRP